MLPDIASMSSGRWTAFGSSGEYNALAFVSVRSKSCSRSWIGVCVPAVTQRSSSGNRMVEIDDVIGHLTEVKERLRLLAEQVQSVRAQDPTTDRWPCQREFIEIATDAERRCPPLEPERPPYCPDCPPES
jgi:hypothetical protein